MESILNQITDFIKRLDEVDFEGQRKIDKSN